MKAMKAWVYGRVQGVGFRYYTQREAKSLGVKGYAKNLDDGSVEVFICGEQQQVDALLNWLKVGPRTARVERVLAEPCQPDPSLQGFTTG